MNNTRSQTLSTWTRLKISKIRFSRVTKLTPQLIQTTKQDSKIPPTSGTPLPTERTTSVRKQASSSLEIICSSTCGVRQILTTPRSLRQLWEKPLKSLEQPFFIAICITSSPMVEFPEFSCSLRATSLSTLGQREAMPPWMSSCVEMLNHWRVFPFWRELSSQDSSMLWNAEEVSKQLIDSYNLMGIGYNYN